jgi:cleavage stimulation factor subunit 1
LDIEAEAAAAGIEGASIAAVADALANHIAAQRQNSAAASSSTASMLDDGDHNGLRALADDEEERPDMVTKFVTTHKDAVLCAAYSRDGSLVATGSDDASIKLLDVEKMKAYNALKDAGAGGGSVMDQSRPVTRTLYDHTNAVTSLEFHPHVPVLFSASRDCTIRVHNVQSSQKRAFRIVQDSHAMRAIAIHPAGDHVLAACDHPMIRLYDVHTKQAYMSPTFEQCHSTAVNDVAWAPDGRLFASAGQDGYVRVWDGRTMQCVKQLPCAHQNYEVSSVEVSANGKYLLTSGRDSLVRLWDIDSGAALRTFVGSNQAKHASNATFTHNESFVLATDENQPGLVAWNTRTGAIAERFVGHLGAIRRVAASPVELSAMSCSADRRARFWHSVSSR